MQMHVAAAFRDAPRWCIPVHCCGFTGCIYALCGSAGTTLACVHIVVRKGVLGPVHCQHKRIFNA